MTSARRWNRIVRPVISTQSQWLRISYHPILFAHAIGMDAQSLRQDVRHRRGHCQRVFRKAAELLLCVPRLRAITRGRHRTEGYRANCGEKLLLISQRDVRIIVVSVVRRAANALKSR